MLLIVSTILIRFRSFTTFGQDGGFRLQPCSCQPIELGLYLKANMEGASSSSEPPALVDFFLVAGLDPSKDLETDTKLDSKGKETSHQNNGTFSAGSLTYE
jgi:hypothetical protein